MSATRAAEARIGCLAAMAMVGFLFVPALAGADGMGGPTAADARKAHAEADTNGDGQIDREEFHRRIADLFYLYDTDRNGFLTADELVAVQEKMVLVPADRNDDGKLTVAEYIDQRFEAFDAADTNSDGLLSVDEVVAFYTSQ